MTNDSGGVAIIGMSARVPGAATVDTLWTNLVNGVESIRRFSREECLAAGLEPAVVDDARFVRAWGHVDEADAFDAGLFRYNPRDAQLIDAQQRLFLECAWEALEHASYAPVSVNGGIGVFAGVGAVALSSSLAASDVERALGRAPDFVATRVSYKLDLRGPSVGVQTACSTSLVAVHLAAQSLLRDECELALAGGASIPDRPMVGYRFVEGGVLSPDGRCRAFDARASGTVCASGVAVVVLKRLDQAVRAGDRIYAVIKGSSINNDGARKVSFTAPSVDAQATNITRALTAAAFAPETIRFIEAHGTGTTLGDPIEVAALVRALDAHPSPPCYLGSIKTNLGHLDAAAGVIALIKAALALYKQVIPPSLHFVTPNPQSELAESRFRVNTSAEPWPRIDTPRRAGVNSLGIGGTNAFVALEEGPSLTPSPPSDRPQLAVVSARTPASLERACDRLAQHLRDHPHLSLTDVAVSLRRGRTALPERIAIVARTTADAGAAFERARTEGSREVREHPRLRPLVMVCPGQGAQYERMGAGLYAAEPVFRAILDECADSLAGPLGLDIRDALGYRGHATGAGLTETSIVQPALFAVSYATARLWLEWGIRTEAYVGHSLGEYVAACLGGVFTLGDALDLVVARGRIMQQMPVGAMLSVGAPAPDVQRHLDGDGASGVGIAAINAPDTCVIAGPVDAVAHFRDHLDRQRIATQYVPVQRAFHSPLVDMVLDAFEAQIRDVRFSRAHTPIMSAVTGRWLTEAEATNPSYWVRQVRAPVQFAAAISALVSECGAFLEVGPGNTMGALIRRQAPRHALILHSFRVRRGDDVGSDESESMLNALGRLWCAGAGVDWTKVARHENGRGVPLPTYAFDHEQYPTRDRMTSTRPAADQRRPQATPLVYSMCWRRQPVVARSPDALPHNWLIFRDNDGRGDHLADALRSQGHRVSIVGRGNTFACDGDRATIDSRRRDHYEALIDALYARSHPIDRVVHLWSHGGAATDGDDRWEQGPISLLRLGQALRRAEHAMPLRLWAVTDSFSDVVGDESLTPEHAAIASVCRGIQQEVGPWAWYTVDMAGHRGVSNESWERLLLPELLSPSADESLIAYRGAQRWVPFYRTTDGDDAASVPRFRERGVYAIIGGLGAIGSALAAYLRSTYDATIVSISRRSCPSWLSDDGSAESPNAHPAPEVCEVLRQARRMGSLILEPADVGDGYAMRAVRSRILQRCGAIHGVIHAAGLPHSAATGFADLLALTPEHFARHRWVKERGTQMIATLFGDDQLDFVLLMSSLSVLLGGPSLTAYAAANAVMDTLAASYQRTSSVPWITVNWDAWTMGDRARPDGPPAIGVDDGIRAIERIVRGGMSRQLVVTASPLDARIIRWASPGSRDAAERPTPSTATGPSVARAASHVAPRDPVERRVAAAWTDVLHIDPIGIHDDFLALGGHSLLAIQVLSRLRDEFNVPLAADAMFRSPTVAELAATITRLVTEDVAALTDAEARRLIAPGLPHDR